MKSTYKVSIEVEVVADSESYAKYTGFMRLRDKIKADEKISTSGVADEVDLIITKVNGDDKTSKSIAECLNCGKESSFIEEEVNKDYLGESINCKDCGSSFNVR